MATNVALKNYFPNLREREKVSVMLNFLLTAYVAVVAAYFLALVVFTKADKKAAFLKAAAFPGPLARNIYTAHNRAVIKRYKAHKAL